MQDANWHTLHVIIAVTISVLEPLIYAYTMGIVYVSQLVWLHLCSENELSSERLVGQVLVPATQRTSCHVEVRADAHVHQVQTV